MLFRTSNGHPVGHLPRNAQLREFVPRNGKSFPIADGVGVAVMPSAYKHDVYIETQKL